MSCVKKFVLRAARFCIVRKIFQDSRSKNAIFRNLQAGPGGMVVVFLSTFYKNCRYFLVRTGEAVLFTFLLFMIKYDC